MTSAFRAVLLSLILMTACVVHVNAGPIEDAVAAYKKGDYVTAFRLFCPLATKGEAAAQHHLGLMYYNGYLVQQTYAEALTWFRRAANQGYALSQSNLAMMYKRGHGVAQDHVEAAKWYRRAAQQGLSAAQNNLGLIYAKGQGVLLF